VKVFWVGWTFPDEHQEDKRIASSWPKGVKGWTTGYGHDYTTWVGRVEAESAEEAESLVLSMYGELASHVEWRWSPEEKPWGWKPSDRFPD